MTFNQPSPQESGCGLKSAAALMEAWDALRVLEMESTRLENG